MREPDSDRLPFVSADARSLDLVFDLLSDRRRRIVLYALQAAADDVADVEELAETIVAQEETEEGKTSSFGSVTTTLKHVHLPKLEDAGVIEHDERSDVVRYWGQPAVDEWLRFAYEREAE